MKKQIKHNKDRIKELTKKSSEIDSQAESLRSKSDVLRDQARKMRYRIHELTMEVYKLRALARGIPKKIVLVNGIKLTVISYSHRFVTYRTKRAEIVAMMNVNSKKMRISIYDSALNSPIHRKLLKKLRLNKSLNGWNRNFMERKIKEKLNKTGIKFKITRVYGPGYD